MAWYSGSWGYRAKLTVDNTKVSADQTNFPIYVDLADFGTGHAFWTNVETDGKDIRVTQADEVTEVPREMVDIDTTAKTGEIHFNGSDTLSSSVDTDYYIYYGNASALEPPPGSSYGQYNVWDSNTKGVWHLSEAAESVVDSTENNVDEHDPSTSGGTLVDAKVGKGLDFSGGSNQRVVFETNVPDISPTSALQFQMWFNADVIASDVLMYCRGNSTTVGYGIWFWSGQLRAQIGSTGWSNLNYPLASLNTGQWYWFVGNWDGSTYKMYLDGVEVDTGGYTGSQTYSGSQMTLASRAAGDYFDGTQDEVQVHDIARSATWISTTYNNQNSPSTFYTTGAEEENAGNEELTCTVTNTIWASTDWPYRMKIKIAPSKVQSDLTDFTVFFDLSAIDASHNFWTAVQSDGRDMRMYAGDGVTQLPREVAYIDTAAKIGELHFKADLSGSVANDFYLYYGNTAATEPSTNATYGKYNAWDSNHKAVWHLSEDSAEDVEDSTRSQVNEHDDGGVNTSIVTTTGATGKQGRAMVFDGVDDIIIFDDGVDANLTPTSALQVEMFLNPESFGDQVLIQVKGDATNVGYGLWIWTNQVRAQIGSDGWNNLTHPTSALTLNQWIHVVGNWDGSTYKLYVNGVEEATGAYGGTQLYTGTQAYIGARNTSFDFYDGTIDDVRIHDTARTAEWIGTMYSNVCEGTDFYAACPEESATDFDKAYRRTVIVGGTA